VWDRIGAIIEKGKARLYFRTRATVKVIPSFYYGEKRGDGGLFLSFLAGWPCGKLRRGKVLLCPTSGGWVDGEDGIFSSRKL